MATNKILHLFTEVSMICSHDGLSKIAGKEKVDLKNLSVGEFVLFANRSLTAMKLFAAHNVIIYYRAPDNRPIDIRALKHIPQFVSGSDIGYDRAILAVLREKYAHLFRDKK